MNKLGRLTLTVVWTLLFIGLAVLGEGGVAAFFGQPALAAAAAATLALALGGMLSRGSLSSGETEDRANRWVLAVFLVLSLAGGYLPALTDRLDVWTFGGDGVRWLGIALYFGGGAFRLWPVYVLGRRFSGLVAIQPGHELVTDGIFATIRNPSYLGLLVSGVGWGLTFRSGVGLLLAALWVPPLVARMRSEERLLHAHFGAAYDAYRARTWRLIPGLY